MIDQLFKDLNDNGNVICPDRASYLKLKVILQSKGVKFNCVCKGKQYHVSNLSDDSDSMLSGDYGVTCKIKKEISKISSSFVYIGFLLWEVQEYKYYLSNGYKNVADYAEQELGFKKSSTFNFIRVCETFSIKKDGKPSMYLSANYDNFGYSKLCEMLSLSDSVREEITSDMTVKQVREINKLTKQLFQSSGIKNNDVIEVNVIDLEKEPERQISLQQENLDIVVSDLELVPEQDQVLNKYEPYSVITSRFDRISNHILSRRTNMENILGDIRKNHKGKKVDDFKGVDLQMYLKAKAFLDCLEEIEELMK